MQVRGLAVVDTGGVRSYAAHRGRAVLPHVIELGLTSTDGAGFSRGRIGDMQANLVSAGIIRCELEAGAVPSLISPIHRPLISQAMALTYRRRSK